LGLLPQVTNWDFAIFSESLSISLAVMVLALLVHWLIAGSRWALAALTLTAVVWTFVRPEVVLMVGLEAAVIAIRGWRDGARRRVAVLSAGLLIGAATWVVVITPTVSRTFTGWSATHLSLDEETLTYRLRHQVLTDAAVKAVFRDELGMPDCPEAERIAAGTEWRTVDFGAAYRGCPQLKAWASATRQAPATGSPSPRRGFSYAPYGTPYRLRSVERGMPTSLAYCRDWSSVPCSRPAHGYCHP
jgi:hypothetical protein